LDIKMFILFLNGFVRATANQNTKCFSGFWLMIGAGQGTYCVGNICILMPIIVRSVLDCGRNSDPSLCGLSFCKDVLGSHSHRHSFKHFLPRAGFTLERLVELSIFYGGHNSSLLGYFNSEEWVHHERHQTKSGRRVFFKLDLLRYRVKAGQEDQFLSWVQNLE
jgi:hypothetical protein